MYYDYPHVLNYSHYSYTTWVWNYPDIRSQVDNKRPMTLFMAFGSYAEHSVTVTGYVTYQKTLNPSKGFLRIYDNHHLDIRYIDYACLW